MIDTIISSKRSRKGKSPPLLISTRQQEKHKKRLEEIANRKVKAKINPEVEHNIRMNENKRLIHKF